MTPLPAWARRAMREICDHILGEEPSAPVDVLIFRKAGKVKLWLAPRRKNEKQKATQKRKSEGSLRSRAASRAIRNAVRDRCAGHNNACCEACMTPLHGLGEWDHWLGGAGRRKPRESVATTWLLCRACHGARTESLPSAEFWNQRFGRHCEKYGYPFVGHIEHAELPGRAAR